MALSTAQMARMSRLLDEALDLDEAGRRRWLESLEAHDQDLQEALRSALLPDEEPVAPTLPKMPPVPSSASEPAPGARVGPYELVRHLGRGGMAQVWLARRADGAYQREVALKLPAAVHLRGDVHQRFARERDILAALEHPGIARFYDAGVDSGRMPYFAMEYVAGKTLTAWCDEARLGIRQRLELFLQVLEAVQYAHDRGVLHRDLKPSNVLVTESGQVRLLDFGVARMFGRTDSFLTVEYGPALTPEFASPEQLAAADLGPPSDVYSLGVLLCELLCGQLPYRLEGGRIPAEIPALSRRPSSLPTPQTARARASSPRKLARRLRGDLDAIILKALAHNVQNRYVTAQALADDVRRYLNGLPVAARSGHPTYRAGKFLLRHRAAAALGAATVMLLIASIEFGYPPRAMIPTVERVALSPHPQPGRARPPAPLDKSIAVLPFADMSEKHDQEYFSDGLAEELIDRLSHSPDLRVVSRTSSFFFKGKQATIPEIASTLHVSYVLAGSVRKAGNALRIAVQLIRASDGLDLWSRTYDRTLGDIFKTQEDIAQTTAQALKVALGPGGGTRGQQISTAAYTLLLQGNFFSDRVTQADSYRAIEFYRRAIALQPDYAMAWAKLAEVYFRQALYGWRPILQAAAKSKEAAEYASALDPDLALSHRVLGALDTQVYWNWQEARSQLRRAIELDPDDMLSASNLALMHVGRFDRPDEVANIARAWVSRDPLDTVALNQAMVFLFYGLRYSETIDSAHQLILLNPSYAGAHAFLAAALLQLGRPQEALAAAQRETDEPLKLWALSMVYWALDHRIESDAAVRGLDTKHGDTWPYFIADVHAYRGEIDDAFHWLDRAYLKHDTGLVFVRVDPFLQNLHRDSRYRALLIKMKLDVDPEHRQSHPASPKRTAITTAPTRGSPPPWVRKVIHSSS